MPTLRSLGATALASLAATVSPDRASASDIDWINPSGGVLSNPDNWSGGAVPGVNSKAVFAIDAAYTLTLDRDLVFDTASFRAGDVTLDPAGFHLDTATGDSFSNLRLSAAPDASTTLRLRGSTFRSVNGAALVGSGPTTGPTLLDISGPHTRAVLGFVVVAPNAALEVQNGATLTTQGSSWGNASTLSLRGRGLIADHGTRVKLAGLAMDSGATLDIQRGAHADFDILALQHGSSLRIDNARLHAPTGGLANGDIILTNNAEFSLGGDDSNEFNARLVATAGSSVHIHTMTGGFAFVRDGAFSSETLAGDASVIAERSDVEIDFISGAASLRVNGGHAQVQSIDAGGRLTLDDGSLSLTGFLGGGSLDIRGGTLDNGGGDFGVTLGDGVLNLFVRSLNIDGLSVAASNGDIVSIDPNAVAFIDAVLEDGSAFATNLIDGEDYFDSSMPDPLASTDLLAFDTVEINAVFIPTPGAIALLLALAHPTVRRRRRTP